MPVSKDMDDLLYLENKRTQGRLLWYRQYVKKRNVREETAELRWK